MGTVFRYFCLQILGDLPLPIPVATVTKLLASAGATVGTYTVGTSPYGVAFDGTTHFPPSRFRSRSAVRSGRHFSKR